MRQIMVCRCLSDDSLPAWVLQGFWVGVVRAVAHDGPQGGGYPTASPLLGVDMSWFGKGILV